MKRNHHLKPLSWEHHAALVIAARIEKGLARGADPTEISYYALRAWERWLVPHFQLEEELLPPLLGGALGDITVLRRLFREHEEFNTLVDRLRAGGEELPRALRAFAWALRDHIRFEEREMLPMLQVSLSEEQLETLGDTLRQRHEQPETDWAHRFWENGNGSQAPPSS